MKVRWKEFGILRQYYCIENTRPFVCIHFILEDTIHFSNSFLIIIDISEEIENKSSRNRKLLVISCCYIQSSDEWKHEIKNIFPAYNVLHLHVDKY